MHHFPKHKPSQLDDNREGARNNLYAFNNGENWEGITEAAERAKEEVKTPQRIVEDILDRLHARLAIADGSREHVDKESGEQMRVDPKKTKNIISQASQALKSILDKDTRARLQDELSKLRVRFRKIKK